MLSTDWMAITPVVGELTWTGYVLYLVAQRYYRGAFLDELF